MIKPPKTLEDYFAGLRFYPQQTPGVPVERVIASGLPHKVYLRDDLKFNDKEALKALKAENINLLRTEPGNHIMSTSSHLFSPAGQTKPILVSFKFNPEHDGKAPAGDTDAILKPLKRIPLSDDPKGAWIDILPEVQPLSPDDEHAKMFQEMLLRHCDEQNKIFWDSKVDYRRKRPGVLHDDNYPDSPWPERSNIGLIPVIKDGAPLKDPKGNLILAPIILDEGSVIPKNDEFLNKTIPNLVRTDITFRSAIKDQLKYNHDQIAYKTKDAPSLSDYVSGSMRQPVDITYDELIGNYTNYVREMAQVIFR